MRRQMVTTMYNNMDNCIAFLVRFLPRFVYSFPSGGSWKGPGGTPPSNFASKEARTASRGQTNQNRPSFPPTPATVFLSVFLLNSLCNQIIYCYRKKSFFVSLFSQSKEILIPNPARWKKALINTIKPDGLCIYEYVDRKLKSTVTWLMSNVFRRQNIWTNVSS